MYCKCITSIVGNIYTVKVRIFECNISITLKTYSFLHICVHEHLFCDVKSYLKVCPCVLDTPCKKRHVRGLYINYQLDVLIIIYS